MVHLYVINISDVPLCLSALHLIQKILCQSVPVFASQETIVPSTALFETWIQKEDWIYFVYLYNIVGLSPNFDLTTLTTMRFTCFFSYSQVGRKFLPVLWRFI